MASCASESKKAGTGGQPSASGDLIRSDFASGELTKLCENSLNAAQARIEAIEKIPAAQRTFQNTVLEFEKTLADTWDVVQPLTFMKYVSPDKDINKEGAVCEEKVGEFSVKAFGRRELYNAIKDQKSSVAAEHRLLVKMLEGFEANGLKLANDKLAQVTALFVKLNNLQNTFSANNNNDNTTIEATKEELEGTNDDFLSRLKKTPDNQRYIVTTKVTDYTDLMQNAKSEQTRKRMAVAYANRQGIENTKLLEEALQVRQQIASLMGFKTWADYQLSRNRMAKDSKTVMDFLYGLKDKLSQRNKDDIAQLLTYKKTYDPKATAVQMWDINYLGYQLKKRDFQLDNEMIKEYFPSDRVVQEMFKIYSTLFGVRYEEVAGAHSWNSDVKLYKIIDMKDDRLIGYFYTDFIPRQGKYSHFAAFTLISGRMMGKEYNQPVSAIVGNFSPPSNGKPSLLSHDQVTTLFHEFGHIMHQTLTKGPYASLSGSNTAQDFVEAPSQMLENWVWEEKILDRLSGHYQDASKKLPKSVLTKMIQARDFQQGYHYSRQLMLALTDMTYHTSTGPVDTAAIYDSLFKDVIGVDPVPGGHFAASFGHLMGGYDAGYYGYLWSEVYAQDMYSTFQAAGILDSATGDRYRRTILEQGNMEDSGELLTKFLGRPSNNEAFLKKLHISNAKKVKATKNPG
jgi:thimet oligopeptidase